MFRKYTPITPKSVTEAKVWKEKLLGEIEDIKWQIEHNDGSSSPEEFNDWKARAEHAVNVKRSQLNRIELYLIEHAEPKAEVTLATLNEKLDKILDLLEEHNAEAHSPTA